MDMGGTERRVRVGILRPLGRHAVVMPMRPGDFQPLFVLSKEVHGAPFDRLVEAEETRPAPEAREPAAGILSPTGAGMPQGRVLQVLGDPGRPDDLFDAILASHGIPRAFPPAVLQEADACPQDPEPAAIRDEIRRGRRDLRSLLMVTIDGEEAKDLDDAVSIESLPSGGWRLGVHIADVSHYVREGSPMDLEARRRTTSVYPAERVVPMLPPRLSNGLCSLNPDRDRLALTLFMDLDAQGRILADELCESVIRSAERMTYTDVRTLLGGEDAETARDGVAPCPDRALAERYRKVLPALRDMRRLALRLERHRSVRGALVFDFPETQVLVDDTGHPIGIRPYPTTFAHGLIESFMIACNERIALRARTGGLPFLYRVHELPDPDKLQRFLDTARLLGLSARLPRIPKPGDLAVLLEDLEGLPAGAALSTLLLRSLAKARYAPEPLGHFGLAARDYCHFTSPIRRYPDLFIHRVLKATLHGDPQPERFRGGLAELGETCSRMEREADLAERDVEDMKKALYMKDHLGEIYEGTVTGFVRGGIFVRLDSTIEGLLPFSSMDDYIEYDEESLSARARRSGQVCRMGDRMAVQAAAADPETRRIEWAPVGEIRVGDGAGSDSRHKGKRILRREAKAGRRKGRQARKTAVRRGTRKPRGGIRS